MKEKRIGDMLWTAAEYLPKGWEIVIRVERGYGVVEVWEGARLVRSVDPGQIMEPLWVCVESAMQAVEVKDDE